MEMGAEGRRCLQRHFDRFTDVASVKVGASAIQGLAATLGFECDFHEGNFVIAAKAGACLRLGGSGEVAGKVGADQIGNFFMCIAHQLKQADYKKITGMMRDDAFTTFNQILFLAAAKKTAIKDFINTSSADIEDYYNDFYRKAKSNGSQFIRDIEKQLKSGWGWFAYLPPEARGAMLAEVVDIIQYLQYANNIDLKQSAALVLMN
jgi:hypothetical protein